MWLEAAWLPASPPTLGSVDRRAITFDQGGAGRRRPRRPAPFSRPRRDARADPLGGGACAGPLPALASPALSWWAHRTETRGRPGLRGHLSNPGL